MWEKVSAADAVSSANNGQVVLACNTGHVAVVIPGGSGSNVRIAQAGATNGKNMSVDTGFGSQTRYYFRYKGSVTPSTTNNNSNSYSPPATPGQQRQYIIKAGDTLTAIAQRELGNANRWREIVKTPSGGIFTEAEARQLRVGQSVYLPVSYQSGSATPVASAPSARPIVNSDIRWVNFSGTVGHSMGVNLRNSTRFSDRSSRNQPNGKRLEFDAWTYGEVGTDMWNGNQDARWFKVKGTNLWVPSAYINGNPPNSSPMPGSGAIGNVTIGVTPIEDSEVYVYPESFVGPVPVGTIRVKSDHYLIIAGVKRLYEDKKKYGNNFPADYYDQLCRHLFQVALQKNGGHKLKAFEELKKLSDGELGVDIKNHYNSLIGTDKKNGWDKVMHFAHSAYHRYTKGHLVAAVMTRGKEFNDLIESWFGQDPEGWSDDDMIANYKGITFAAEHGELEQAFENFKASAQNFINNMGLSMLQFLIRLGMNPRF
jgi:hypothetical protein